MPTVTAGLYEVVLEQVYYGQSMKNVFHYIATLNQDDDQDKVAVAFDTTILEELSYIQSAAVLYTEIRVANLTGFLADFSMTPTIPDGAVVGDVCADFVAIPFRYVRTSKETRNGSKRFAGLTEANAEVGGFTSAFFTQMTALAVFLGGQISGGGIVCDPVILHKPDISGVWLFNEVANVLPLNRQTTQNSRKAF